MYVFLEDSNKKISASVTTSMNNYNVISVKWSKREEFTADLSKQKPSLYNKNGFPILEDGN